MMREPRTTDTMLRVIDRFLTDKTIPQSERRQLWSVMTALRGPDNDGGYGAYRHVKALTTVQIRQAAFPLVLEESLKPHGELPVPADFTTSQTFNEAAAESGGSHFAAHITY